MTPGIQTSRYRPRAKPQNMTKRGICAALIEIALKVWSHYADEFGQLHGAWVDQPKTVSERFDLLAYVINLALIDLNPTREWHFFVDIDDADLPTALIYATEDEAVCIEVVVTPRTIWIDHDPIQLDNVDCGALLLEKVAAITADVYGKAPRYAGGKPAVGRRRYDS